MKARTIAAALAVGLALWTGVSSAQLATVRHVGPSYLYPDPVTIPGAVSPDIRQANHPRHDL